MGGKEREKGLIYAEKWGTIFVAEALLGCYNKQTEKVKRKILEVLKMKKILSVILCALMVASLFAGCFGGNKNETGSVYYLNFKPEQDEAWQNLAKKYTEQTGVKVDVLTAAEGKYQETLTAEMDKNRMPTLFQISGEVGLESWGDYCYDLSDSEVYNQLTTDDFALIKNNEVLGVAYVYEGYGIIVNKKLLSKAGYKIENIKSFADLKQIAEDITAYYASSEQIPTACGLGVLVAENLSVISAGGYLIQLLPGTTEEEITQIENNIKAMPPVSSMLRDKMTPEEICFKALEGFNPQVLDTMDCKYSCNCSRERVEKAILSLGEKEIEDMIAENKTQSVNCHFCNIYIA